jgi:hypothetical protein
MKGIFFVGMSFQIARQLAMLKRLIFRVKLKLILLLRWIIVFYLTVMKKKKDPEQWFMMKVLV